MALWEPSLLLDGGDETGGEGRGPFLCAPWSHILCIAIPFLTPREPPPPLPHTSLWLLMGRTSSWS